MASTAPTNSTLIGIYQGGVLVGELTDASFEISHSPRDVTSKDSAGWTARLEGLRDASSTYTAWFDESTSQNFKDSFAIIGTRASVEIKWGSSVSGDTYYQMTGWITSLGLSSPGSEDTASYSCSFSSDGAVTEGTVV